MCLVSFRRGRPAHLTASDDNDADSIAGATEEEASVIVQLANRVQDGTRCRSGSLDMCIQGKCQVNCRFTINLCCLNFIDDKFTRAPALDFVSVFLFRAAYITAWNRKTRWKVFFCCVN